jgi:hypothetical protein
VVPFDGPNGLYADLASGNVPNYSFIAPNQCNDQHGRGNGTQFCQYDPERQRHASWPESGIDGARRSGPSADRGAIHASPAWKKGHNAIVTIWDEDDYSIAPTINQVAAIVDTNYGFHNLQSNVFYTHFSLLKTIEGGFKLPCLNHACDASTAAMTDLFGNCRRYQDDGVGLWAMEVMSNSELIGDCGIIVQQVEGERLYEIGYHLRRDLWHQGLATEAAIACRDWAFAHLKTERVISLIRPDNLPSQRVAERNGMTVWKEITWRGLLHKVYSVERGKLPRSQNNSLA